MPLRSAKARQSMWEEYHKVRSTKLVSVWENFLSEVGITNHSVLLMQMVNDVLFQELIKHYTTVIDHEKPTKAELSELEETILRYASGFVPYKLINHFKKLKGDKYSLFVECLLHLSSNNEEFVDSSFLEYTKRWTSITNRGGLFETNDQCFMLFKEVERTLQPKLQHALLNSATATEETATDKESLIAEVVSDDDVCFYWSLCSIYIPDEGLSNELLTEIVKLWLTIRGFSLAKEWIEKHKWEERRSSAKAKSLRKALKDNSKNT